MIVLARRPAVLVSIALVAGCGIEGRSDGDDPLPAIVASGVEPAASPPGGGGGGGSTSPCILVPPSPWDPPPGPGSIDVTFGCQGVTSFGSSTVDTQIRALGVQSGDKIIAAGETYDQGTNNHDVWVARFTSSGALDTTFGTGGVFKRDFTLPLGGAESVEAVLVQPSGAIVLGGGYWREDNGLREGFLVRLTPGGALDPSFASGGIQTLTTMTYVNALASSDGTIVAAGEKCTGNQSTCVATVGRYSGVNGAPEAGFGSSGVKTSLLGGSENAHAYAVTATDKAMLVVGAGWFNEPNMGMQRHAKTGLGGTWLLDGQFGVSSGIESSSYGPLEAMRGVAAVDTRYVAAESIVSSAGVEQFVLHLFDRFADNDFYFANGGRLVDAFSGYGAGANAVVVTPTSQIIGVGWARDSASRQRIAVARATTKKLDTTFSTDGNVMTAAGGYDAVGNAVVLQSNGHMVVGGWVRSSFTSKRRAVLVRIRN